MPELPEVETYRRYFNRTSLHKKISTIEVKEPSMLGNITERKFLSALKGNQFIETYRHGKYFFTKTNSNNWLVLHFGMTGFLKYFKNLNELPSHTRLLITFSNGYQIAYDCQRKLGLIDLTGDIQEYIKSKKLGIDPYNDSLSLESFIDSLKNKKGAVKSVLMNQNIIAGIGNIYSDEILFQSNIYPGRKINTLNNKNLKEILNSMNKILQKTVAAKAQLDKYPKKYLFHYRGKNEKCPLCGGKISKETIGGRSSYFCNSHQE